MRIQQKVLLSTSTTKCKDAWREDFYKKKLEDKKLMKEQRKVLSREDPFKLPKIAGQAFLIGLGAATILGIAYGAYDPGFRRKLRTTYPYATLWLDMLFVKEVQEDEVVLGQEFSGKEGQMYRKEIQEAISPFKENLRRGFVEVSVDDKN